MPAHRGERAVAPQARLGPSDALQCGALPTARYGTALAPIYLGMEQGYGFTVFADETRPLLQGARLTAWSSPPRGST